MVEARRFGIGETRVEKLLLTGVSPSPCVNEAMWILVISATC